MGNSIYESEQIFINRERQLKEKVAEAMTELTEYWSKTDKDFTLSEEYPFNESFDELTAKVKKWAKK